MLRPSSFSSTPVDGAYRPSACLHFAAFVYVGESVSDPGKCYRNNVAGSLTLLEALRDHDVDQFVLSSTCATYGVPDKVPIDETLTQAPINPYAPRSLLVERPASAGAAGGDWKSEKFAMLREVHTSKSDAPKKS